MKLKVQTKKKFKLTLNEQQAKWLTTHLENTFPHEGYALSDSSAFLQELKDDLNIELMDFTQ